jgi:uncharacterized membrane protein
MKRSRKIILGILLATVVLAGSIGGVVYASSSSSDNSDAQAKMEARWQKIATIYEENTGTAIDADQLKAAFQQADKEMRQEAESAWLDKLAADGKITQDQADQYKTWLESKPDVSIPFGPGMGHGFGGHGGFPGWGAPPATDDSTTD